METKENEIQSGAPPQIAPKGSLSTLTGMEINDKNLVILCATILAVVCVITLGADALGVVGNALTGMFGVAVGKALNK